MTLQQYAPAKLTKSIIQRYSLIEKIKEAEVIGILVGTVVVEGYLEIMKHLKVAILKASKKYYEVLVGKLNEPKLKNFQFVDLYVMVGCPLTSLIDPKEFLMPVVTPHELFMALEEFPWESRVQVDFANLLPKLAQSSQDLKAAELQF
mmetsp:Transcript_41837/g.40188  ORF Transcript_41837/g.40188 Transcript_41837/m.40188 type:complete len:148 (+) Transcript_41837:78-521(+)